MKQKLDEKILQDQLPNLSANVDDRRFDKQFIRCIEPESELDGDPSVQEIVNRATATKILIDKDAGRMEIALSKNNKPFGYVYQDLKTGDIHLTNEDDEPLATEIKEMLVAKNAAINDVDNPEEFNFLAHAEVDGFI